MNKNLCLFLPYIGEGGLTKVMLLLAEGLLANDYSINLVIIKGNTVDKLAHLLPKNIKVTVLNSKRTATSIIPLAKHLQKTKPDILLSGDPYSNCTAIIAASLIKHKIKTIITEHSIPSVNVLDSNRKSHKALPFIMKRVYPKAHHIVAVSNSVAFDLSKLIDIDVDNIKVIYNPIVSNALEKKINEDLEHEWIYPKKYPTLIFVGRLVSVKNIPLILSSFAEARKRKEIKLIIVGDGPKRDSLAKIIKDLGIENDVDLIGYIPNPLPYIKKSDALILTSLWEGLPTVLIEALACNTPIIVTDNLDGAKEITDYGRYGTIVPNNDIFRISEAILDNLTESNKTDLRSRANFFSLTNSLEQYMQLMES